MSLDEAETVNDEWPNKCVGSGFLIRRLIEWNPNIAAYDENNELMGWCLRLQAGALGALQVRKNHMRKGIGSLLVLSMCKILANSNLDAYAMVNAENFNNQRLFLKLGFKYIDEAYWLRTYPTNGCKEMKWSDNEEVYY